MLQERTENIMNKQQENNIRKEIEDNTNKLKELIDAGVPAYDDNVANLVVKITDLYGELVNAMNQSLTEIRAELNR